MQNHCFNVIAACVLSAMMFSLTGCGGSGEAKYIPSEASSKEALNAALQAWLDGQAHGPIASWKVQGDCVLSHYPNRTFAR